MDHIIRDSVVTGIILVIFCIIFILKKRGRVKFLHIGGLFTLAIAMVFVYTLTGVTPMSGFHLDIRLEEFNLIPFKGIIGSIKEAAYYNDPLWAIYGIVGNIILLCPLGVILPLLCEKFRSLSKTVLVCFLVSFCIEGTQIFLCRGTDIDDLILNTIGGIIGYISFSIFNKIFKKVSNKFKVEKEFEKYIIIMSILVPYMVIVILGFYDRYKVFHFAKYI